MIQVFDGGLLGSNTYLYVTDTAHAMIVDCGTPPDRILAYTRARGIAVDCVILTHGHYDHIDFVGAYAAAFPEARLLCHRDELALIGDPEGNLSRLFGAAKIYAHAYVPLDEGDTVTLPCADGTSTFTVLHTPGHTVGSLCLYHERERLMFTGDTLFASGYGRVDLKYASPADMRLSLRRLSTFRGTTIYPGHGESCVLT